MPPRTRSYTTLARQRRTADLPPEPATDAPPAERLAWAADAVHHRDPALARAWGRLLTTGIVTPDSAVVGHLWLIWHQGRAYTPDARAYAARLLVALPWLTEAELLRLLEDPDGVCNRDQIATHPNATASVRIACSARAVHHDVYLAKALLAHAHDQGVDVLGEPALRDIVWDMTDMLGIFRDTVVPAMLDDVARHPDRARDLLARAAALQEPTVGAGPIEVIRGARLRILRELPDHAAAACQPLDLAPFIDDHDEEVRQAAIRLLARVGVEPEEPLMEHGVRSADCATDRRCEDAAGSDRPAGAPDRLPQGQPRRR